MRWCEIRLCWTWIGNRITSKHVEFVVYLDGYEVYIYMQILNPNEHWNLYLLKRAFFSSSISFHPNGIINIYTLRLSRLIHFLQCTVIHIKCKSILLLSKHNEVKLLVHTRHFVCEEWQKWLRFLCDLFGTTGSGRQRNKCRCYKSCLVFMLFYFSFL